MDSSFEAGGDDLPAIAGALEQARRRAKSLLDRGLTLPRGEAGEDVGQVNLVPFRRVERSAPEGEAGEGDPGFRAAVSDYLDDLYHPPPITGDRLRQIAADPGAKVDGYAAYLDSAMTLGGILTPSQRAAFLGQAVAESGLRPRRESLNYSDAQRAANIFYRRFGGDAERARPYLGNSEKMANHVYSGLNGNGPEASGDGYTYRGGGFLQITGRDGYRAVGLEDHPQDIESPDVAARVSVDHWLARRLNERTFNPITSQAAFDEVTRVINKGLLQGRQRWEAYGRGLKALGNPGGEG